MDMRAITQRSYGGPEIYTVERLPVPEPGPGEIKIEVRAASLNPADWYLMTGTPLFIRLMEGLRVPKSLIAGSDVSGIVSAVGPIPPGGEVVGPDAGSWQVGDEVVAKAQGGFAEFAVASADRVVAKPSSMSFVEAAGLPIAGVTALEAVVERGQVVEGTRVLINGASGGVGCYAVQLAVAQGAHVTGVCSTANVELVRKLGAHEVIDYTATRVRDSGLEFDCLIDNVGSLPAAEIKQLLVSGGRWVMVGAPKDGRVLGPLGSIVRSRLAMLGSGRTAVNFVADETASRLAQLTAEVDAGRLRTVVDRAVSLESASEAMAHLASGRAVGKVVLEVD